MSTSEGKENWRLLVLTVFQNPLEDLPETVNTEEYLQSGDMLWEELVDVFYGLSRLGSRTFRPFRFSFPDLCPPHLYLHSWTLIVFSTCCSESTASLRTVFPLLPHSEVGDDTLPQLVIDLADRQLLPSFPPFLYVCIRKMRGDKNQWVGLLFLSLHTGSTENTKENLTNIPQWPVFFFICSFL